MRNLLDFLLNYKHWFLFVALECVCLMMLVSYNGYQKSVYFTTANGVVGYTYSLISSVTSYLNLQTENADLEAKNQILRRRVLELEKQLATVKKDSVHISGLAPKYDIVSAEVVGATTHRSDNLMTINKGEADGIRPEMGVVCSNGVVGVVYLTSAHYSIVIPIINRNSRISCKLRGTQYFGTLTWNRGRADIADIVGIPRHAQAKKGDVILTNGFSDIFPPGIPVGYVIGVKDSPDGMASDLRVALFTKFGCIREVSVITNYSKPERRSLENKADSLFNNI